MRTILMVSAVVVAGAATVVHADDVVFSPVATESCLAAMSDSQDPQSCIGASANACMEATDGGWSTYGMGQCLDQELQYWDARLNTAYKSVRAKARAIDAEMAELGSAAAKQADALLAMQRAWIGFRDASCDYERSLWGGGSGGGPATVSCHMSLTAQQALYLEASGLGE